MSQPWWLVPIISVLKRLRQQDFCEFQASQTTEQDSAKIQEAFYKCKFNEKVPTLDLIESPTLPKVALELTLGAGQSSASSHLPGQCGSF